MDIESLKTTPEWYLARADRLPTWGLSYPLIWALGFSFFITTYDIVNIGFALPHVPFVTSASEGALAASLGLFGYVVGAPIFSYVGDQVGRVPTLILTALFTAVGSFGDAFAANYLQLAIFRFMTGMAIGADLVLVMVYMGEQAPAAKRGLYTNLAFIAGWAGIGIGPFLAAEIVTSDPLTGWRITFGIGGILAVSALMIRLAAPETVRFLSFKGKFDQAENLVSRMERAAIARTKITSLPEPKTIPFTITSKTNPLSILARPKYLKKLIVLFFLMFFVYFVDYPFLVLPPTWARDVLGFSASQLSSTILLFGLAGIGALLGAILLRPLVDRFDRRVLIIVSILFFTLGTGIMGIGGVMKNLNLFFVGAFIAELIGVGWYNLYYLICQENFPTQARATGYALADGVGHLGGALGLIVYIPIILGIGSIVAWTVPWIDAIILGILTYLMTPKTLGKRLEQINEATE